MKKPPLLVRWCAFAVIYSCASYASGGKGHVTRKDTANIIGGEQERYYPDLPAYSNYQDPRSHQGFAGGVVGGL